MASKGDPSVAYTILTESGSADVIGGTMLSLLGDLPLAFYLVLSAAVSRENLPFKAHGSVARSPLAVAAVLVLVFELVLSPLYLVVLTVSLIVIQIWLPFPRWTGPLWRLCGLVAFVVVFTGLFTFSFWRPREVLETSTSEAIEGYVLSSDGQWTTVLTDDTRIIRRRSEFITSRSVCDGLASSWWMRPLAYVVHDPPVDRCGDDG